MTNNPQTTKGDPEIERILTMADSDLLDEALAAGVDVHEVAERGRLMFSKILARHGDAESV